MIVSHLYTYFKLKRISTLNMYSLYQLYTNNAVIFFSSPIKRMDYLVFLFYYFWKQFWFYHDLPTEFSASFLPSYFYPEFLFHFKNTNLVFEVINTVNINFQEFRCNFSLPFPSVFIILLAEVYPLAYLSERVVSVPNVCAIPNVSMLQS